MHKFMGWTATAAWLLNVISTAVDATADRAPAQACCEALIAVLGSKVVYPPDQSYRRSLESYFYPVVQQVNPTCLLLAESSHDVATAVETLGRVRTGASRCQFAVRSGGHDPWPDSANIRDGVTIDLSGINSVSLSEDGSVASVGSGARWGDVYRFLDRRGQAIVGGRDGRVGVGGLTTGGGLSFFTARYGFVCDGVKNFEVVLGSGEIVNANLEERPDLFQVLKGGSNNFGIVTRFDFFAFEQGDLWGGVVVYPGDTLPQHIDAFVRFTDDIPRDPYASVTIVQSRSLPANQSVIANTYAYTKPEPYPAALRNFTAIQPELVSGVRVANLTTLVSGESVLQGGRGFQATLTFLNRADVIAEVIAISNAIVDGDAFKDGRNATVLYVLQPIPRLFSDRSLERGGNILGLDRTEENLVLYTFGVGWTDAADDATNTAVGNAILQAIDSYLTRVGAKYPYVFMNYALRTQDVLTSYGPDNVRKLQCASRKYDPAQVFQRAVPGGYKIPRGSADMEGEDEGGGTYY